LVAAALLARPLTGRAVEPLQGALGCPTPNPDYVSNCTTLTSSGSVKAERSAINERGCLVFGAKSGSLRPVNQPAVFYGMTTCPARGPQPPDSPGVVSPFRERLSYTLIYAGKVYSWPGPDGTRVTDWKCWWDGDGPGDASGPLAALSPQEVGPCVVCY